MCGIKAKEMFMEWYKNLSIANKITVFVVISAIFLFAIGAIGGGYNYSASVNSQDMYENRLLPIKWLNSARNNANGVKADLLELMLTNSSAKRNELLADISRRRADNNNLLKEYKKTRLDDYEKDIVEEMDSFLADYRSACNQIIGLTQSGRKKEAFALYSQKLVVLKGFQDSLKKLSEYNSKVADKLADKNTQNSNNAITIIITSAFAFVALSVVIGLNIAKMIAVPINDVVINLQEIAKGNLKVKELNYNTKDEIGLLSESLNLMSSNLKDLVKQVQRSAEEVSASAEEMTAAVDQTAQGSIHITQSISQLASGAQQIAKGIAQLSGGAQEQAKNISDSVDKLHSVNEAIQTITDGAQYTAQISEGTESNAQIGRDQAEKAVCKVNQIKVSASETSNTINELGHLSSKIETIVDLIKNIANQTNLLALNAAIEAARAGEHGKGFAVVADEVKKLANQSAEATEKITEMIKDIQNKTNSAVMVMDMSIDQVEEGVVIIESVGHALEEILKAAKATNHHVREITTGIMGVSKNSDSILRGMENISAITEETVASTQDISSVTEQSAAGAEEISTVSEEQSASLEEINASAHSLAKIAEALQTQIAVFKI